MTKVRRIGRNRTCSSRLASPRDSSGEGAARGCWGARCSSPGRSGTSCRGRPGSWQPRVQSCSASPGWQEPGGLAVRSPAAALSASPAALASPRVAEAQPAPAVPAAALRARLRLLCARRGLWAEFSRARHLRSRGHPGGVEAGTRDLSEEQGPESNKRKERRGK